MIDGDRVSRHGGLLLEKILRGHRERRAIVYIRQSTVQQIERHQESTRLQYVLVDRAFGFGWRARRSWSSMMTSGGPGRRSKGGEGRRAKDTANNK